MKIGILYPRISHYREEFFQAIMQEHKVDFFIYESKEESNKNNFKNSQIVAHCLKTFSVFGKVRLINIFPFFKKKYDVLILIGEMRSFSVWLLLFLMKISNTKTILWGHGISINSYIEEKEKLNPLRVVFHKLADHNWLYTEKEVEIWKKYINEKKLTSLNNTIYIEEILNEPLLDKIELKKKHNIATEVNFIFSARFTTSHRRTDLLLELIKRLDGTKYGFIIIGDGELKPSFKSYNNVYDFGAVYDKKLKNELFQSADIYLQPGWIGLSCTEALAYGKMVLTFERSAQVKQCVEYAYLNHENSYKTKNIDDLISFIHSLDRQSIEQYGSNAREYAKNNLSMETMISNALDSLSRVVGKGNFQ